MSKQVTYTLSLISIILFLCAVFVSLHFAHAASPKLQSTFKGSPSHPNSPFINSFLEHIIASRIGEYSAFESHMPQSISSTSQSILTTELSQAIASMQTILASLKSTTTSPLIIQESFASTTKADSLLTEKLSILSTAFRSASRGHTWSTSSSTVRFAIPAETSLVPSDIIDQIITASSFNDFPPLVKQMNGYIKGQKTTTSTIDVSTTTTPLVTGTSTDTSDISNDTDASTSTATSSEVISTDSSGVSTSTDPSDISTSTSTGTTTPDISIQSDTSTSTASTTQDTSDQSSSTSATATQ